MRRPVVIVMITRQNGHGHDRIYAFPTKLCQSGFIRCYLITKLLYNTRTPYHHRQRPRTSVISVNDVVVWTILLVYQSPNPRDVGANTV